MLHAVFQFRNNRRILGVKTIIVIDLTNLVLTSSLSGFHHAGLQ